MITICCVWLVNKAQAAAGAAACKADREARVRIQMRTQSSVQKRARKRKHKRRIRITPRGYLVLGVFVLFVLLIVLICMLCCGKPAEKTEGGSYAAAPGPEPDASAQPEETPVPTPTPSPEATPSPNAAETPGLSSAGVRLPSAEQEAGAVSGLVRASGVALRKGSSKSYGILRKCEDGEALLVYAQENEYTFVKTLADNQFGYIATQYVQKFGLLPGEAGETPRPASRPGGIMGIVNVEEMYLRGAPSKEGNEPLGLCKKDTLVWVYFQTDKWYYVEIASTGECGYLYAQYIMTQSAVPAGTPVP